nr:hypothetical protein CACDSRKY_CACDSRKY_CDS_0007 [Caudoviricetes sp.]
MLEENHDLEKIIENRDSIPYGQRYFRSRGIMPDWIYAALFLAILALGILLVGAI